MPCSDCISHHYASRITTSEKGTAKGKRGFVVVHPILRIKLSGIDIVRISIYGNPSYFLKAPLLGLLKDKVNQ